MTRWEKLKKILEDMIEHWKHSPDPLRKYYLDAYNCVLHNMTEIEADNADTGKVKNNLFFLFYQQERIADVRIGYFLAREEAQKKAEKGCTCGGDIMVVSCSEILPGESEDPRLGFVIRCKSCGEVLSHVKWDLKKERWKIG